MLETPLCHWANTRISSFYWLMQCLAGADRRTKTKHFANISITKQNINIPFLWWVNNYSLGWDGAAIIQLISGQAESANERPEIAFSNQSEAGIWGNFSSKFGH